MPNIVNRQFKEGDVIFYENELGDCAYIIEKGSVDLFINCHCKMECGEDCGIEQSHISTLSKGALFGEMALIDNQCRCATAIAAEDCELIAIPNDYFDSKLFRSDKFILLLLKTVQQRYREMRSRLDKLLQESTYQKHLEVFSEIRDDLQQTAVHACLQLKAEQELTQALENNDLKLAYQPIVSLKDNKMIGCEALIRWQHPQHGLIMPMEFIDLAEQTGLIIPIGLWIIEKALKAFKKFQDSGLDLQFISINLSGRQFGSEKLIDDITRIIKAQHSDPHKIKFEITESVLMEESLNANLNNILNELEQSGFRIALDDFGTGYSSFTYLHRFPIDTLKIDKSFVYSMSFSKKSFEIVKSICVLAQSIGLTVIAEGVESPKELKLLMELGVDCVQGFFFSKPLFEEDFLQFKLPQTNNIGN